MHTERHTLHTHLHTHIDTQTAHTHTYTKKTHTHYTHINGLVNWQEAKHLYCVPLLWYIIPQALLLCVKCTHKQAWKCICAFQAKYSYMWHMYYIYVLVVNVWIIIMKSYNSECHKVPVYLNGYLLWCSINNPTVRQLLKHRKLQLTWRANDIKYMVGQTAKSTPQYIMEAFITIINVIMIICTLVIVT